MQDLNDIIMNNEYIKSCSSNKKKDINSISSIIDRNMSQSDCIKFGNGVEKVFKDIILKFSELENKKEKNKKGKKERDHFFKDEKNKIIYYAELKGNLNLDTEKSKSTILKCLDIVEELKEEYPDYLIKWCLLGFRYIDYNDIPIILKKRYSCIKDNVYGINQYLSLLNIDLKFTDETYKIFINKIADIMFNNS